MSQDTLSSSRNNKMRDVLHFSINVLLVKLMPSNQGKEQEKSANMVLIFRHRRLWLIRPHLLSACVHRFQRCSHLVHRTHVMAQRENLTGRMFQAGNLA